MFPIVTLNEPVYMEESGVKLIRKRPAGLKHGAFRDAFLAASVLSEQQLPTPSSSVVSSFLQEKREEEAPPLKLSDFLDIPSLISDDEEELSEAESSHCSNKFSGLNEVKSASAATQEVKRFMKEVDEQSDEKCVGLDDAEPSGLPDHEIGQSGQNLQIDQASADASLAEKEQSDVRLNAAQFASEKQRVMKIVVKYIAMKISNSFPPESPHAGRTGEMPLESFLMILASRLQLTFPVFMKGIIYLFRYMDIIYLLRYLNQSNNFANYTDMGFGIKKLIIGCFRLTLARERIQRDWSGITGLSNSEINTIVKAVVKRLNGKLVIKNVEVVRVKTEIFRFVKMVTTTV